jgi:hypothetical protein
MRQGIVAPLVSPPVSAGALRMANGAVVAHRASDEAERSGGAGTLARGGIGAPAGDPVGGGADDVAVLGVSAKRRRKRQRRW